jgi:RNA polymerase sigma-70 factor (ECF subfamily)
MEGMLTAPMTPQSPDPDLQTAQEIDLARRAASGDPSARRAVVGLLLDRVRTTVKYLSAGDRDADDCVQLSLLEILAALSGFRGESALGAWADRIAVRTSMRALKRRRFRESRVALVEEPLPGPETSWDDPRVRLEVRRRLAGHLDALDLDVRSTVVLKLVHGYSVDEIAELTDAPRDTVKGRLKRGRKILRRRLEQDPALMGWTQAGMES